MIVEGVLFGLDLLGTNGFQCDPRFLAILIDVITTHRGFFDPIRTARPAPRSRHILHRPQDPQRDEVVLSPALVDELREHVVR